jgi:RNA polymerase sigma-70 factor (ECF subfamily)
MSEEPNERAREMVEAVYRADSRRVFATLIRLLGDFDLAEEALHEAFRAALEQWPREGVPTNPHAWLVSTGRFKAIDGLRRRARFTPLPDDLGERLSADASEGLGENGVKDDRLRLIFTCCHPALPPDAQVALTLREVCGLTTEETPTRSSRLRPPLPSASCALRRRSAPHAFPIRCPHKPSCRSGGFSNEGWPSCRIETANATGEILTCCQF